MKKMTKLLSVILAFVMALSCMTMMASAAKTSYKTVDELTALKAYSPYGTVTRLSTEERMSILMDTLDMVLGKANINMGTVMDTMGLKVTLDFRSVDQICGSLDTLKSTTSNTTFKFAKALVDLGILEDAKFDNWIAGMSRDKTAQMTIVNTLLNLLKGNVTLINTIFTDGLKLGLIANFLTNVDTSQINNLVKNVPGAIENIVYPLFSRPDNTSAEREVYVKHTDNLITAAQKFATGLFTKPMNWTSYRVNAAGADLGYTQALPTTPEETTRYFEISSDKKKITQYDYQFAGLLGSPKAGYVETVTYTLSETPETEGSDIYLYKAPEGYTGDQTLKWYKSSNPDANGRLQSPYWLPSVKKAIDNGTLSININGDDSLLSLLYDFLPYVFDEMAVVVLNGSVKYELAKAFGVEFNYIGKQGSAELTAATAGVDGGDFFTKGQDFYLWEYSDYKVIGGIPYYRFQNDYYVGTLPKDLTSYYNIFNWDWNIDGTFFNEFIPDAPSDTANILDNLNKIIYKAINTVILPNFEINGKKYARENVFVWNNGGNDQLLDNVLVSARKFIAIAPEEIFGDYYDEAQFYDVMMNGTMEQAIKGVVCELVKLLMPQIKFSGDIVNQPITAIAAIVVRELCTQLMPTYDFDDMIYANYGTAGSPSRALKPHTADEWLDITLYMGVNLGMYYLRNIADVGEDFATGYYSVMKNLGALPSEGTADAMTFGADAYKATIDGTSVASWMVAVDWIIDWALDVNTEWCWHFGRLVNVVGDVNLSTYQNPFNKINSVLVTFIPELEKLLNTSGLTGADYGSNTWLEKILKDGLVDNIVNLNLPGLLNMFKIQSGSVLRRTNIANEAVKIIVTMLNSILKKVCGGANLIPTSINSVEALLDQGNIKEFVISLVGKLYDASATYNVLDPVMPIIGFFAGWTTDPQKYSEPQIYFSNSSGAKYLKSDNSPVLKFANASSGMLLTHRNSSETDKPYTITVKNITLDGGVSLTNAFTQQTVLPGATIELPLTVPASKTVTMATVTYAYTGKDGQALGGDQTKVMYAYVSDVDEENQSVAAVDSAYNTSNAYNKYVYTKDIYSAITTYGATFTYKAGGIAGTPETITPESIYSNTEFEGAPKGIAATYFMHITSIAETGFEVMTPGTKDSISGKLYKAKAGVTAETFSPENSKANNLYGTYDMGTVSVKSRAYKPRTWSSPIEINESKAKDYTVDFIYYTDYGVSAIRDKYVGYGLQAKDFTDSAKWAAYDTALREVIKLSDMAMRLDYVTATMPTIEPAIAALENAYKDLTNGGSSSSSSGTSDVSKVEAALAKVETNPDRELNFQDYKLFEYFQYEKQRNAARSMINSVKAPTAPENHIENGVWGNDIINAIVAAQTNDNVKAGINATIVAPTDKEMEDYKKAAADFKPATYSDLQVDDQAAKVAYYAQFMKANPKGNIDKNFLNQEIAYAEAQNYVQSDYSADSWARYTEALANAKAKAAASDATESVVFDAKYELMVAQNYLERHSMKESGYLEEELIPLIAHANAIIENYGTIYTLKNGVTYEDAFKQLVEALGVKYSVTIDEKVQEGILYDRSAITFTEYDRNDSAKNKRAVDTAADKLRAAIENFENAVRLESNDGVTTVDQSIRYIQNIAPNSIANEAGLLARVKLAGDVAANVTTTTQASKSGHYGTGSRVEIKNGDVLLVTYFVVINGDVNGDGAVDAFDALEVDLADKTAHYMGDVYDDAADSDGNGIIDATDYAAVKAVVTGAKK